MNTFSPFRAAAVLVVLVVLLVGMIGRVAYLQTYGRQENIRRAERMQNWTATLRARPGSIFDRNGIMMAGSVQTQILYVDPKFMQDEYQVDGRTLADLDNDVTKLSKIIDKNPIQLSQLLSDRATSRFVKVADNLDDEAVKHINELHMPGLGMIPMNVRYYPMGSIAAHVLGSRGKDGKGLEGLELKYDNVLTGKDGYARMLKDARRRSIEITADNYLAPEHGKHLMLTIDANIQMIAEQELAAACEKNKAKRGEVVVMDPQTGDVLALANYPTFNPQNLEDSTMELRRDNALVSPFEPGSIIKPFIMSPALAWHVTRPDEIWPLHGATWITPYGRPIKDVHGYPELCTWDVLVKSSNIGMSMLGNRLGNARLHQAVTGFGFGQPTGIELPGEDPGRVNALKKWSRVSTESISQGYELMVTPIQLARAMCAIANGGRMVYPRIVKGELDPSGNLIPAKRPTPLGLELNVIDPITAAQVRRILCDVPIRGTAKGTRSFNWNLWGKTGTAHISNGKSGYSETKFNSSYLGGAPFENPRLVIAMLIHEPDRSIAHYGGAVSAPAANRALSRMLAYLQVPASPDLALPPENLQKVIFNYNAKEYARSNAVMKDDEDPQD
jgi:cell division protein FtsI (penicillin-binding protein 3)